VFPSHLLSEAEALLASLRSKGLRVATAESCTGGLVAALLTEIPGSSDVVEGGLVTYSNEAKQKLLGISEDMLARFGAVSEQVARGMASGVLIRSLAHIAVSTTGIAGPGGATRTKPVGLVHFGAAGRGGVMLHRECRFGDIGREAVRMKSVEVALQLIAEAAAAAP
jgi:nicotinamide-nucleotide amidase